MGTERPHKLEKIVMVSGVCCFEDFDLQIDLPILNGSRKFINIEILNNFDLRHTGSNPVSSSNESTDQSNLQYRFDKLAKRWNRKSHA